MASSKLTKAHKRSSLDGTNMLSNLPEDVKEKILTYLPIKEAGKTSILSRKWRYVWASIPELTLSDTTNIRNIEKFVDAIFVLHNGPIRKFSLSTTRRNHEAFDRWIVNLSRNGIRELTLDVSDTIANPNPAYMHSRFFSCDELYYINLSGCSFKVPDGFKGFKLLHTLELKKLKISDGEIEKLISSCPLLEKLKLQYRAGPIVSLNVDVPNLLSLDIYGTFTSLQLCTPKLRFLCLVLEYNSEHIMSKNLERVLGNLPDLESFDLGGLFLEYSCAEPLREGCSLTFNHLKYLSIDLDFETEEEDAFTLSLFQGAPHLQSLHINVCSDERSTLKFWETVDTKADLFKHLQTVKIIYIVADSIFSFVKFILDFAPQLETLIIEEDSRFKEDDESETVYLKPLLLHRRASPNAQIIFK